MPRKKEEKKGIFNFLNKNVKDFNKIVLSLGCISFLLLMGFISYKINNSYAYFTNDVKGSKLIEMTYTKPSLDESGANAPELTNAMIPVYYDETNNVWKKADKSNSKEEYKWYDYDNKIWANAVTVTETNRSTYLSAKAGTEIPMNAINTMWVWIPRYTYTYLSTNTPEEINIKFEKGTTSSGTISCKDAINQTNSDGKTISEICTDTTNNGLVAGTSTYTHPAFWWDKNDDSIRDKDEELTGIWVGKFEVSSDTACAAGTSATVGENCNLTTIRPKIVPNVTSWTGAMVGTFFNGIYKMRESGNQYGFSTTDETHMMKNMEWGAVAYLYHSKYGRCTNGKCEKIGINNCSKHITGIGNYAGTSESDDTCTNSENQYNNTRGKLASTTGNVYGIYDMSGGAEDYVMGNGVNSDGKPISGISNDSDHENSGFTGYLTGYLTGSTLTGSYEFPSKRYYNQYSYVKGSSSSTAFDRGKLGDATKEMSPSSGADTWYSNYSIFSSIWFYRGGSSTGEGLTGIFSFGNQYGKIESGWAYNGASSRAVISNLK